LRTLKYSTPKLTLSWTKNIDLEYEKTISRPYKQIPEGCTYANIAQKRKTIIPKNSCKDLTKTSSIKNATITHWILCMCAALRGSSWPIAYRCICRTYSASIVTMLIKFIAMLYIFSGCAPQKHIKTDCRSKIFVKNSATMPTVVNAQMKKWMVHRIYKTMRTGRHGLSSIWSS